MISRRMIWLLGVWPCQRKKGPFYFDYLHKKIVNICIEVKKFAPFLRPILQGFSHLAKKQ